MGILGGGGGGPLSGCHIDLSSPVRYDAGQWNIVEWHRAQFDNDNYWSLTPNPEIITAPRSGIYIVTLGYYVTPGGGNAYFEVTHSDGPSFLIHAKGGVPGDVRDVLTDTMIADAGDTFTVQFYHENAAAQRDLFTAQTYIKFTFAGTLV